MNDLFAFEASAWDLYAQKLTPGDRVSAAELLAMLEGYSDEMLEDAFDTLDEYMATLEIRMLPKTEPDGQIGKRLALEERLARKGIDLAELPEGA